MVKRKQSRAAARSKSNQRIQEPEDREYDEQNELSDLEVLHEDDPRFSGLPKSVDIQVKQWLERKNFLDSHFTTSLYFVERENYNVKEYLDRYEDRVPTEQEIGMEYGSGKYLLVIQIVDSNGKRFGTSATVYIHKKFDEKRRLQQIEGNNQLPMLPAMYGRPQGNGIDDSLKIMQSMIAMLIPLIRPQQQPKSYSDLMAENFKSMNEVMKEVYLDQSQMYNDLARRNANLDDLTEGEEETGGIMGILDQILPMIENFLPTILGRGQQSRVAVQTIKKMPGYEQVVKDAKVIKSLVEFITKNHGEDTASELCKKFGIRSPRKKQTVKKGETAK